MPHLGKAIVASLVAIILFRPISPYSATVATLTLIVTLLVLATLKGAQIEAEARKRRTERRRLLADCEHQHAALMAGDDGLGVYGLEPTPENLHGRWWREQFSALQAERRVSA